MSKRNFLLALNFAIAKLILSGNVLDFNNWDQPVGSTQVLSQTSLNVQLVPPLGSSILSPPQNEGMFCLYVQPTTVTGAVMSVRVKTGEAPNTHLMEFLWTGKLSSQNKVFANLWDASNVNLITGNQISLPNSATAYYCLSWKIGGRAIWYADGIAILEHSIADFTLPLLPEIATYGDINAPWFIGEAGVYNLPIGKYATWSISNGYLSNTQDSQPPIPILSSSSPSLLPTLRPTNQPSTMIPTFAPSTLTPSTVPSQTPTTSAPTISPSKSPTAVPSQLPSSTPSFAPTRKPTSIPTTNKPTIRSTFQPTFTTKPTSTTSKPAVVSSYYPTSHVDVSTSSLASSTSVLAAGITGPIVFLLFIGAIAYWHCFKRAASRDTKSHKGSLITFDIFPITASKQGQCEKLPLEKQSLIGLTLEKLSSTSYVSLVSTPSDASSNASTPFDGVNGINPLSPRESNAPCQKRRFSVNHTSSTRNDSTSIIASGMDNGDLTVRRRSVTSLLPAGPEDQV